MKIVKKLMLCLLIPAALMSCEWLEALEGEPSSSSSSSTKVDNSTYTYTYTCPIGSKNSIQIPNRLSATCKKNWEYFARTYGCNDADNFANANKLKAQCP